MSIICWDGKILAADSRAVNEQGRIDRMEKVWAFSDYLFAGIGSYLLVKRMQWAWQEGKYQHPPLEGLTQEDIDQTVCLILSPKELYLYYPSGDLLPSPLSKKQAYGSGSDFALGAMAAGAGAVRAVEIACQLSAFCGPPVVSFPWPPPPAQEEPASEEGGVLLE